jgi:phage baseplate assembly protein gpV
MAKRQTRSWQREHAKQRIGKPLTWICPRCGAQVGEFCISRNGNELTQLGMTHNQRITPNKTLSKSYRAWIKSGANEWTR